MQFETSLLTESLSTSMLIFTILVMLHPKTKGAAWGWTVLLNLCFLVLIFLRPVFIALVPIMPVMAAARWLQARDWRPLARVIAASAVLIVLPMQLYCFGVRARYGFWGMSCLPNLAVLGLTLRSGLFEDAPAEYSGEKKLIKDWLAGGGTGNPFDIGTPLLDFMHGRRSGDSKAPRAPCDMSLLGEFASACARNNPRKYIAHVASNVPWMLCAHSYPYGAYDYMRSRQASDSWLSAFHTAVYLAVHKPLHSPLGALPILILASLACLATAFRKAWGMLPETIGLLCVPWAHVLVSAPFAYSDVGRFRAVIDVVIFMIVFIAVARLVQFRRTFAGEAAKRGARGRR